METKQHLIAVDLDGTLLTDDKTISKRNLEALEKAADAGHIVVIATGRPHRSSIDHYHTLGLNTPMVNFNGALIHHPANNQWNVLHNPMSIRTALRIVDACYEISTHNIVAEVMDNVYLDRYDEQLIDIFQTSPNSPFTIGSLKNNLTHDPTSLLIHPKEENIQSIRKHLEDDHAELIEHRKWGGTLEYY
ncbi:hypothetical protein GCM10008983_07290 [Lentibacillus halophilus]|uniref:Uncharacterized protein n=1 Tax=Lentibacillus halophilus TaxID=295065 RepID=A0ABN0Z4W6_9BACI